MRVVAKATIAADHDARHRRDSRGVRDDAPIEMQLALANEELRAERGDPADGEQAGARRANRRDDAEYEHLEQELPHDASASGAERGAHRELALSSDGAREHDVRHVGTRQHENECGRGEEDPQRLGQ